MTGLCILAAGIVILGLTPYPIGFYAAILIMAVGQSLSGTIPLTVMLCRWFVRRRASVIADLQIAPSLSGIILAPVISLSLAYHGWQLAAFVLAGLTFCAAIPVLAWLRNRPEDIGLLPNGVPPEAQSASLSIGRTLRTRAFWLIAFGDAFTSAAAGVVLFFLVSLISDRGFFPRSGLRHG